MKSKLFLNLCLIIFAALTVFVPAQAQTYDAAVNVVEGSTYIRYTGAVSVDTTASTYTQAMLLADANQGLSFIRASMPDVAGTEDVNVLIEFSNDLLNWTAGATTVIDQLSTTAVFDSLSTINSAEFLHWKGSVWFRLVFDGQTGNPSNTVTFDAVLPKNSGAPAVKVGNAVNRRS